MPYTFATDDSGAVTVDWVVLTAALVGLGLATMGVVSGGVEDLSVDVEEQLYDNTIIKTNFNDLPDIASSLLETMTAVGSQAAYNGALAGIQANMASLIAGDTAPLRAEYDTRVLNDADHTDFASEVRRQLDANGTLDLNALETYAGNLDNVYETAASLQTIVDDNGGDLDAVAYRFDRVAATHGDITAHYEHELKRRGELPQG